MAVVGSVVDSARAPAAYLDYEIRQLRRDRGGASALHTCALEGTGRERIPLS
ncbi:MAG: hypothetical protein ACRDQA_23655 [Nocardioidaceae bacterium]